MYAMIGAMADSSMNRLQDRRPEKIEKKPVLKICPLCDLGHYRESRYCCEEHRIEYKKIQKAKKKRKKKKRFKH